MSNKRALMMVKLDPPMEKETEWNKWYNSKHVVDRLAIPGFLSARRFVAVEGEPKYLTLYDVTSVDVLISRAYLKLRDSEVS